MRRAVWVRIATHRSLASAHRDRPSMATSALLTPPRLPHAPRWCTLANISHALPAGSSQLQNYLRNVYGADDLSLAAQHFLWNRVGIIWLQHMPPIIRKCAWPLGPLGRDSVFMPQQHLTSSQAFYHPPDTLLVYRYDELCPGNWLEHGHGSGPLPPRIHDEPRHYEVTHVYAHDAKERHLFFMYQAIGSGLFYHANKTLESADYSSLAEFLNLTSLVRPFSKDKDQVWTTALIARSADYFAKHGIDTLVLTHHTDVNHFNYTLADATQNCTDFYKTEIIHLRATRHYSCPRSDRMSWGWHGSREPCTCVHNAENTVLGSVGRPNPFGRGYIPWPYTWIQCSVDGAEQVSNLTGYRAR